MSQVQQQDRKRCTKQNCDACRKGTCADCDTCAEPAITMRKVYTAAKQAEGK
jgi:hypothetical protein